jgi:hypothetical protein
MFAACQRTPTFGMRAGPCARVSQPPLVSHHCGTQKQAHTKPWETGFVPHIIPRTSSTVREGWSEWQDLNLRPPRPERGIRPHVLGTAAIALTPLVRAARPRAPQTPLAAFAVCAQDFFPKASPTQLSGRLVVSSNWYHWRMRLLSG